MEHLLVEKRVELKGANEVGAVVALRVVELDTPWVAWTVLRVVGYLVALMVAW